MDYATNIFKHIETPNIYLYTALIDGYISSGFYLDGIQAYARMMDQLNELDPFVIASILKGCGLELALREGKQVHSQVLKIGVSPNRSIQMKLIELYGKCGEFENMRKLFDGMPERDVGVSTVLISCYFRHGLVEEACAVFDGVLEKDTVCWTAMVDGFVRSGEMNKALEVFRKMQRENVRPNEYTIVCVLSACSQLGALELGRWVHSYVSKYRIKFNRFVGSALVCMYSRCGSLEEAERVFNEMEERDVSTYNSMLAGFAIHGKSSEAVKMFREMVKLGFRLNHISFVGILNACSHGGLVDLGLEIFRSMTEDFGIEPRIEHYGCMVDLLGRVGFLEEAYNLIKGMRVAPDRIIWGSLLGACKLHGNLKLGEKVAKLLVDNGEADSGTYVLLSSIYASSGKWKEAAEMREKMIRRGIEKEPGCSSIEVRNGIHEFLLGDLRHPEREKIYKKLEDLNQLLRLEGYSPATNEVLHDIEDNVKEWALAIHSERLAICYGLISTEPGTPIKVVKNLRICNNCHTMIKLVAKLTKRKIVVRDRNRFHHFEDGLCSCGDYW
ncbi:hypothetical protein GIB67_004376 [Kingdonia uniflora]|uniref:DYW domain-containing protein n=1 Tax=Kingdonia uniflora TaxID=39325 RepID=A0A7J7MRW4_9MAGN|nr:hypothetical protein GIB67_004376 [Kingdonia uniflora]